MKAQRRDPARDKLVDVKRGERAVCEPHRKDEGDWLHLRNDKKPPAASVKRRRKVLA
jgi:hypothetical protein